ncbi:histidine phosphatase family protein [Alteribacter natronophilus]|uniref:histidine phosphatase family protein n=1 Tax=Alteribacter natronophilus TaxID=2583810 RepID=UPI00110D7313|nr:histidine phosphatase family protein [Alteribacter natronophilus]TMW70598.1 histidine phosphatase family protein [Alteribacter natronophilus]
MIVYLIRHGQSEANEKGIIQGHAEFPLSKLGEMQADFAGEALKDTHLDAIFTSDLGRARKTAEAIAARHPLEAVSWEQIREVGLGPLEGKTRNEMTVAFPDLKIDSLLTSGIEGAETVENITKRCAKVTEQLTAAYSGKKVALVSHGGFISIYLMYLIAGENWGELNRPFMIGNTGITKVEWRQNGQVKFHYVNQTAHLEREKDLKSSTVLY